MAPADEAREHMASGEKALKTSWVGFKFNPDHLSASMEFTHAATKFRAAGLMEEAIQAWLRAAEQKEKQNDIFGAGRAYESAGAICDGGGPGGTEAAAAHWEKAIKSFRLCGKAEIAAKLILKLAESREKQGNIDGAKAAFEDAVEVFKEDEKDYNLSDVYKQYIGFLVRYERFEDAMKAIDGHVEVLLRQKHASFAHKELLAKVVLCLATKDTVRADQALNPSTDVEGWYMSKESQVGSELVAAFQAFNAEEAQRVLKEQVFTFLQVDCARLAKKLRVPDFSAPRAPAAAAGAGTAAGAARGGDIDAAAPAAAAQEPQTSDDLAEMLM